MDLLRNRTFLKPSIRRRLLGCFLIIAFVMGTFALMIFNSQKMVTEEYKNIYIINNEIGQVNARVEDLTSSLSQYLSTKNTDTLEQIHSITNELELTSYEFKTYAPTSQINMMIRDIGNMCGNIIEYTNMAVIAKINRNATEYSEEYEKVYSLSQYIGAHCNGLNELLFQRNNSDLQWISEKQSSLYLFIIILFVVMLIESGLYIVFSTRTIVEPIVHMAQNAREISRGNFDTPDVVCGSQDEIAVMADTFNRMKSDIKENIKQLEMKRTLEIALKEEQMDKYRVEALLRGAQFTALQTQIQPHFLFNTINAGIQLAYREGATQTVEFFDNMSNLFRYNLRNVQNPVPLRKELLQVERYLYILKHRFSDAIAFSFESELPEQEYMSIMMPCMIVQPLVENSYAHGIRCLERQGKIDISVCKDEGYICLRVADNGVGMREEDVEKLMQGEKLKAYDEGTMSTGIGLSNVRHRLQMFYNRGKVIRITSKTGAGTVVTVYLKEIV